MLNVKGAYYIDSLPTQIAIVLPDGSARLTDLSPFRQIEATELQEAAALNDPAIRAQMLQREIMDCVYRFYGLTKVV